MAESLKQADRSRSDEPPRGARVAVVDHEGELGSALDERRPSHDLTGESAPRWSFGFDPAEGGSSVGVGRTEGQAGSTEPRRSSFGPAGKQRAPAGMVALSVLTLGLYSLVWHHRVNCEMGDFDPRLQVRPGRSTWAVTIPWLLGLGTTVAGAALLAEAHTHSSGVTFLPGWLGYALLVGLLVVPYVTLLLPFSCIAVSMTLERLRLVQEHTGVPGDRQLQPVRELGRLLLPLTGGLLLMVRAQSRLDDVWDWAETTPNRRRRRA